MTKIRVIVVKEWIEVFRHRLVLFTTLFLPLLFTGIALATLFATEGGELDSATAAAFSEQDLAATCQGIDSELCFKLFMASQFLMLFMIIPVIIPVTIAAYSVVGEKTTRSLEPLLATPITTAELIAGKALAALIPAVIATWLGFVAYMIGMQIVQPALVEPLLNGFWLLAILVVGPLLSVLSVSLALMISSRVTDPRAAEQLSAVVVVPILLLVVGQSIGFVVIDRTAVLLLAAVLLFIDVGMIYLTSRVFQREVILVKWK